MQHRRRPAEYFPSADLWREWLHEHHASAAELWVGYWKRESGEPSLTWPESVDEALCYGWIDGVRQSVDARRYRIRFTPRRQGSTWSAVNICRAEALIGEGRMHAAGRSAFDARSERKSRIYSYEQRPQDLPPAERRQLRANRAAAKFYAAQPAHYRRASTWFVISAQRPETRARRLATLIECSARGEWLPQMRIGQTKTPAAPKRGSRTKPGAAATGKVRKKTKAKAKATATATAKASTTEKPRRGRATARMKPSASP
ncbi:MAG: YdeI/OmpD-associated family protein [Steroidobacteraceae bacterium]